jgi:integrative and conjugative element protein (TIGR02256 family)
MISIHEVARRTMEEEAVRHRWVETGGPLFGLEDDAGNSIITSAYGPGPKAVRRRFSLLPDREETQRLIDLHLDQEQGRVRYLGEWHTHPGGSARLSERDLATLRQIADQQDAGVPRPLAIILRTNPVRRRVTVLQLRAYVWDPELGGAVELSLGRNIHDGRTDVSCPDGAR